MKTFLLYFSIYAITVVPAFSPFALLHPAPLPSLRESLHRCPCPWVMHTCALANPITLFLSSSLSDVFKLCALVVEGGWTQAYRSEFGSLRPYPICIF